MASTAILIRVKITECAKRVCMDQFVNAGVSPENFVPLMSMNACIKILVTMEERVSTRLVVSLVSAPVRIESEFLIDTY